MCAILIYINSMDTTSAFHMTEISGSVLCLTLMLSRLCYFSYQFLTHVLIHRLPPPPNLAAFSFLEYTSFMLNRFLTSRLPSSLGRIVIF